MPGSWRKSFGNTNIRRREQGTANHIGDTGIARRKTAAAFTSIRRKREPLAFMNDITDTEGFFVAVYGTDYRERKTIDEKIFLRMEEMMD